MEKEFTKQEALVLILSPRLQQRSLIKTGRGPETFCFFNYITAACIKYLRPTWFRNDKHDQAFDAMVGALNQYREKVDSDPVYEQIVKDSEVNYEFAAGRDRDHPLSVCNLGLVLSTRERDSRAVNKAFKNYFFTCFTTELAAVENQMLTLQEKIKSKFRNAVTSRNLSRLLPMAPVTNSLMDDPIGNALVTANMASGNFMAKTADKLEKICDTIYIYSTLLLGDGLQPSRMDALARVSVASDWSEGSVYKHTESLRDIAPTLETCLDMPRVFRGFLLQAFMARAAGVDIAVLGDRENPTCMMLKSIQENALEEFAQSLSRERELRQDTQRREQKLEDRISVLKRNLEAAESRKLEDGMTAIAQDELSSLLSKARTAASDLEQAKEDVVCLQKELRRAEQAREKLEAELSHLNTAYADLNEQLINSVEEDGFFVADDEEDDVPGVGLRGRLGDDAVRKLAARRMIVIGGHENTHATLKELFPDWEYYPHGRPVGKSAWAGDAIVCITCYMSHKSFTSAKALAKAKGVRIILIAYNSPISICQHLLTHLT